MEEHAHDLARNRRDFSCVADSFQSLPRKIHQMGRGMIRNSHLSRREAHDGGFTTLPGSHGVTQYHADSVPLPSGSIASPVTALKSLNLTQALIDGLAVTFGLFFLAALFGSLPLAVALMVLGAF